MESLLRKTSALGFWVIKKRPPENNVSHAVIAPVSSRDITVFAHGCFSQSCVESWTYAMAILLFEDTTHHLRSVLPQWSPLCLLTRWLLQQNCTRVWLHCQAFTSTHWTTEHEPHGSKDTEDRIISVGFCATCDIFGLQYQMQDPEASKENR